MPAVRTHEVHGVHVEDPPMDLPEERRSAARNDDGDAGAAAHDQGAQDRRAPASPSSFRAAETDEAQQDGDEPQSN